MKKILSYLLAVVVTAAVTYYFTAWHFSTRHAEQMARERDRWQVEKVQIEGALDKAHQGAGRRTDRPGSLAGGSPLSRPAMPRPAPPSSSQPSEADLPLPRAEALGVTDETPPAVVPLPVSPAVPAWTRYEQTLPGQGSKCRIDGTSSIHDWSMETPIIAGFFEVDARARFDPGQTTPEVGANANLPARAEARIPVRTLKSYNATMDQVYKEHMEESVYRSIGFRLTQLTLAPEAGAETCPPYAAHGELVIHGVTNVVTLSVTIQRVDSDKLKISGSAPLKMTSFGVQPPAPNIAGMPTIQTGDDIMVTFEWVVQRKSSPPQMAPDAER